MKTSKFFFCCLMALCSFSRPFSAGWPQNQCAVDFQKKFSLSETIFDSDDIALVEKMLQDFVIFFDRDASKSKEYSGLLLLPDNGVFDGVDGDVVFVDFDNFFAHIFQVECAPSVVSFRDGFVVVESAGKL